jgi:hypothetical protein
VAGHAELEYLTQIAFSAFLRGGHANFSWLPIEQGASHGFENGRLGATTAYPAVDLSIRHDDSFVTGFARGRGLRTQHSDQGKGLIFAVQPCSLGDPFVAVHGYLLEFKV